ncbi:MAG: hypothetical protein AMXMBFR58_36370 [Phycisphaerae bacterium]|nr:hypothetical protein [Phycisphaerales bacterium]
MSSKFITCTVAALCSIVTAVLVSHAGPLDPPAGPVASTYKTLTEVEPRIAINATNTPGDGNSVFKITQPGSYYLTGGFTGVANKHGVEVTVSDVTIDLNGYRLKGVTGSLDGIHSTSEHIVVVNGAALSWGGSGVSVMGNYSRCEGLRSTGNGANGIETGGGAIVEKCQTSTNGGDGIVTSIVAVIHLCESNGNTGAGIRTSQSTVDHCAVNHNAPGIIGGSGSNITHCSVTSNSGDGILVERTCRVAENTCSFSAATGSAAGIHATAADNRIEGNNVVNGDRGIVVDAGGNIIVRNTCSGNTTDWVLAANNVFGPIVDRRSPASGAVSGFSASGSTGTTDPNANFSY